MSKIDTDRALTVDKEFLYKKGLCGIRNLGNTCFMNSVIQCLSNTIPLTEYFVTNIYKEHLNRVKDEANIAEQWNIVLRGLWYKNSLITPKNFVGTIQNLAQIKGYGEFTGYNQSDSQEFLQFLLESLHICFSREVVMRISGTPKNAFDKLAIEALEGWKNYFNKDYSIVVDLFYGQFITDFQTITNGKSTKSKSYEPFNTLSLELKDLSGDTCTIYDCFDNFTGNEKIDIDDSNINKFKKVTFWKLPKVLIIYFKKYNNNNMKINKHIEYPIECLDLSKYVTGYNRDKYKYSLYGVINHIGGASGGHYYSYVKNYDNDWYNYDDDTVKTLSLEKVISKNAYCLFYKQIE